MDYIDLESVGSTLTKDLLVFPIDISEPPVTASDANEMSGVHLYDVCDEWYCNLSSDDLVAFFNFIESTQELTAVVYNDWKSKIWGMWEDVNNCYMSLELENNEMGVA